MKKFINIIFYLLPVIGLAQSSTDDVTVIFSENFNSYGWTSIETLSGYSFNFGKFIYEFDHNGDPEAEVGIKGILGIDGYLQIGGYEPINKLKIINKNDNEFSLMGFMVSSLPQFPVVDLTVTGLRDGSEVTQPIKFTLNNTTRPGVFINFTDKNGFENIDEISIVGEENTEFIIEHWAYGYNCINLEAKAGEDFEVCEDNTLLNANYPDLGVGYWKVIEGSAKVREIGNPNSIVTNLSPGKNTLEWIMVADNCETSSWVNIYRNDAPTLSIAGTDQVTCEDKTSLDGNPPLSGLGEWQLLKGEAIFQNPNDPETEISNLGQGENVFQWVITNGTCEPSISEVTVTRTAKPTGSFAGNDINTCHASTTLSANHPVVGLGTWEVVAGNASIVDINNPNAEVVNFSEGINTFNWVIQNGNCQSISTVNIYHQPFEIELGGDLEILKGHNTILSGPEVKGSYSWFPSFNLDFPNIKDPLASPEETTTYNLTILNDQGCEASDDLTVFVTDPIFNIPKGFSPDGDGRNDYWIIEGIENYPANSVEIYDRWGKQIFQAIGYNNNHAFDGYSNTMSNNSPLIEDTYFYKLTIENIKETYKGYLVLKRN